MIMKTKHLISIIAAGAMTLSAQAVSKNKLAKAEAGDLDAMCNVGVDYFYEGDADSAFQWLNKAADSGNSNAMFWLGYIHSTTGEFGPMIEWFNKAVDAGNTEAMFNLANCYFNGMGVSRDNDKGVALLRQAADLGEPESTNFLGQIYHNGYVIERDFFQAFNLFKKAAELGDAEAMRRLGIYYTDLYHQKDGDNPDQRIPVDIEAGKNWFEKSAKKGNPLSQLYFVQRFLEREDDDTVVNNEELTKYYLDIVKNPHSERLLGDDAMRYVYKKLSDCYRLGLGGLNRDIDKSNHYKELAGDASTLNREEISRRLTRIDLTDDIIRH